MSQRKGDLATISELFGLLTAVRRVIGQAATAAGDASMQDDSVGTFARMADRLEQLEGELGSMREQALKALYAVTK